MKPHGLLCHIYNLLLDFVDPDAIECRLPQPYRTIDKILQRMIENAIFIGENLAKERKQKLMQKGNDHSLHN